MISEKGPEGKVTAILSRSRTHIAGTVKMITAKDDIIVHAPMLGSQQRVIVQPAEDRILRVGDRIVMEILDWGTKETETVCRLSHYIGHISDPSCDIAAAIEEFELNADFPTQAIQEAHSYGNRVTANDLKDRLDLRSLEIFTIDPDTAKDFDDALNLSKDESGCYHLGVHIADVSHYVRPGTALDAEAQTRSNSTYFPNYCLPMLPPDLSANLCSLKPNVNRLTVSVLMRFDPTGTLINYRIAKSVIKSVKRFSYREAKQVLDGSKSSLHAPTLALMTELCGHLKKKRYERGSIEFALPELAVIVDEKGMPYKTDYIAYDITHQMVEEFMLKANETVASHLDELGKNLSYRIHDEPAEDNLKDFSLLAGAFGFNISEKATPKDLQKLFEEAAETSFGNYLATNYIRRMRLAIYSAENIGHYGLSLSHYCHFTSPIRRYIDLVVHRILFGESDDLTYLQEVSSHCSEQERVSAKAENSVILLKKLRLLHFYQQQEPYKEYKAIITRVKNFGFHFEVIDLFLEGFIHVADLDEDYFIFEEQKLRLRGTRNGSTFTSGDQLTVMLKDVDFISLETKWYIVSKGTPAAHSRSTKKDVEKSTKQKPNRKQKDRLPKERKKPAQLNKGKSKKGKSS